MDITSPVLPHSGQSPPVALALTMGIAGILAPDRQAVLMGFEGNEAAKTASALLTVSSLAAVNTGLLYLLGSAKGWAGFSPRSPCTPGC